MQSERQSGKSGASGRLWVQLLQASLDNTFVKPYCCVDFENNEFVSPESSSLSWNTEVTFDVLGRHAELYISVWDRIDETCLGQVRLTPPTSNELVDIWATLHSHELESVGQIHIQMLFTKSVPKGLSDDDFECLKVVGKGSFGKVYQVRKKDSGRIYAMKVLKKKEIVDRREVEHTRSERNVLVHSNSPFLVGLKYSFQSSDKLYLVLDYKNGGELFYHLQKSLFSEERAKFYLCELVLAIEHLHKYDIIYRDVKPENVLLDSNGHIALTDFGLCKENIGHDQTTNTFCGTSEYLAPEILLRQAYGKSVDWWSLGILFYEMVSGLPPFYSENTNVMYQKILYSDLFFGKAFSPLSQFLIRQLLHRDPSKRLGAGPDDAVEIKRHPYFSNVDWNAVLMRQIKPPFKPRVESEIDTSNFDPTFTEGIPIDSGSPISLTNSLSSSFQDTFKGFTFTEESFLSSSYRCVHGGTPSSFKTGRFRMA